MASPTDAAPPPPYQMSQEEFDQKTSHAIQLASSSANPVDEDDWPIYDPAAFEAVAESYERQPPSSSSVGIPSTDTNRQTRSPEQNSHPEDELEEDRAASPPPAFTPVGPSLDGPPFEEVENLSYNGRDSPAAPAFEPYPPSPRSAGSPPLPPLPPPILQPVEPLRLRSNRHLNAQIQTSSSPYPSQIQASSGPYPSHRQISPRPNHSSTIARVEFDPQMAYSPYGGVGNHTAIRADATAFYNHAVASQLMTSPAQTQSGYMERGSSPYSSGYAPTQYWAQQTMSSPSLHEHYAPHMQNFHLGAAQSPPPHLQQSHSTYTDVGYPRTSPTGTVRGPLPAVPTSLSQHRWAGSEAQIVQDLYGGHA
jgi:hypothetical protein